MNDEFSVTEPEATEDEQILAELQKEEDKTNVLADFREILSDNDNPNYCDTCANNSENDGYCPILVQFNNYIKVKNGGFRAESIAPIENRWGCTSHVMKKAGEVE